ncbi:MAG TPA: hypothetical protein PLT98_09515 [Thauera aminoaromatica]|nr:hypothetical protein [Thauera aminoaromatica]
MSDTFELAGVALRVRDMMQDRIDRGFVASRWRNSYSAQRAGVDREAYLAQWKLIDRLLDRAIVKVVCDAEVPTTIHAFAVGERPDVLHYAYTVPALQGHGLARAAIQETLGDVVRARCTHRWPWASERYRFDWYPLALS